MASSEDRRHDGAPDVGASRVFATPLPGAPNPVPLVAAAAAGGEAASSLDSLESSVSDSDRRELQHVMGTAPSLSTVFRHSGWAQIRKRILLAMIRTNQTRSRTCSFAGCGAASWVQVNNANPNRFRIQTNCCHDRFCTPCARVRSLRIQQALLAQMGKNGTTFITLTLSSRDPDLPSLVDRLYKHFRALRMHPTWADNVNGGAAFLEVKYNDKSKRWHPHLHILCDAKYIPQSDLQEAWHSITKDSYIVDIRRVRDQQVVNSYVTKYATKPLNATLLKDPGILQDTIVALKGRRLCLCFGSWYGTPLSAAEDEELCDDLDDAAGWTNYCSLEEMINGVNNGDEDYIDVAKKGEFLHRIYHVLALNTS